MAHPKIPAWPLLAACLAAAPAHAQSQFTVLRADGAPGVAKAPAMVLDCAQPLAGGGSAAAPCGIQGAPLAASSADGALVAASASALGALGPVTDTIGFNSVSYSLTALPAGATVQVEESPDGLAWFPVAPFADGAGQYVSAVTAPGTYRAAAGARYQRAMLLTYVSGTVTAQIRPRGASLASPGSVQLLAGAANVGRTALPLAAASAPAVTATSATANADLVLFPAGAVGNGCFVQNPGSAAFTVDWGGGTSAAPVAPQLVAAGVTVACPFAPTTNVNVRAATASVAINGGRF